MGRDSTEMSEGVEGKGGEGKGNVNKDKRWQQ